MIKWEFVTRYFQRTISNHIELYLSHIIGNWSVSFPLSSRPSRYMKASDSLADHVHDPPGRQRCVTCNEHLRWCESFWIQHSWIFRPQDEYFTHLYSITKGSIDRGCFTVRAVPSEVDTAYITKVSSFGINLYTLTPLQHNGDLAQLALGRWIGHTDLGPTLVRTHNLDYKQISCHRCTDAIDPAL